MDIFTIGIYYAIIAFSFSISTLITYIRPSIKIAKIATEDEHILGMSGLEFFIRYLFTSFTLFPIQFYQIMTNSAQDMQERMVDALINEDEE